MEDARLLVRKVVGRDVFQRCPRPVSQQFSTQSLCFITVPLISPEISPLLLLLLLTEHSDFTPRQRNKTPQFCRVGGVNWAAASDGLVAESG